jgi:hypothetical protein
MLCIAGQELHVTRSDYYSCVINGREFSGRQFMGEDKPLVGNGGQSGLWPEFDHLAAYSNNDNRVNGNTVRLDPGTLVKRCIYGCYFNGGFNRVVRERLVERPINVSGNRVIATQAKLSHEVFGCYVEFEPCKDWREEVCVHGNIVISSGCQHTTYGDREEYSIDMRGGFIEAIATANYEYKNAVCANCNRVEIINNRGKINAYGGYVKIRHVATSRNHRCNFSTVQASSNTVIIDGGEYVGNISKGIYGGYVEIGLEGYTRHTCITSPIRATNNTVIIKGNPDLSGVTIWGGYTGDGSGPYLPDTDSFTGNKLNIEGRIRGRLRGVTEFEEYNFSKVEANAPAVLSVRCALDLSRSKVGVRVEGEAKEGDRVNLIESQGEVSQANRINIYRNGLVEYEYSRVEETNLLGLIIRGIRATEQAQGINQAASAGVVVVGQGLGFIADRGIEEAVGAVKGKEGVEVFGAIEGERNKYKNVTDVKIEGMKGVGGIAKGFKGGEVVGGIYVEHGKGDYKIEEVEGIGEVRYTGVGGLIRKVIGEKWYIDGSVNLGQYGVEYKKEIIGIEVEDIGYDSEGMYEGIHVGCGYDMDVSKDVKIGLTGKMLVTRQEGKKIELKNGVPIEIEGVVVGKVRGGVKGEYRYSEKILPYVGIGYEYGVFGEGKGRVEGIELKGIELKGGTGIGEIGVESRIGGVRIELRGSGYIGKREGVEGALKFGYAI